MREERGNIAGDQMVYEPYTLWGSIAGNVKVLNGGKFYLRGSIYGNLTVEDGGRVHILGNVSKNLVIQPGTKVILGGVLGGDALNHGGRLYIEATAKVSGKVRSKKGAETRTENKSITIHEDL